MMIESHSDDVDKQTSAVAIGDVEGGIQDTVIAGRDVRLSQRIFQFLGVAMEDQRAQRNRRAMLELVKNIWIKGVLEQSLHGAAMIELGLEERVEAVQHPWDMVVQMPDRPNRALPPGTRILDVFNEMGGSLLILGEPGSGKTTVLLQLTRDTIAHAEEDPAQPIPVVFNLSSWGEKQQPIAQWLIDELRTKYLLPKRIARLWVERDELALLLDGLDEVKPKIRGACIKAINQFREEHGLVPLVICSRTTDYDELEDRLRLQGAVVLQPLTLGQIDEYLQGVGVGLLAVRRTLQHDTSLQELAQSPLMLSIMTLAYQGISAEELGSLHTVGVRRRHLFETYVQRMLQPRTARTLPDAGPKRDQLAQKVEVKRKGGNGLKRKVSHYFHDRTIEYLAWLARKMIQHSQSVFLLEQLQPSWLSTSFQRWPYVLGSRIISALIIALTWALSIYLSVGNVLGPDKYLLVSLPVAGTMSGVVVGLIDGLRFKRRGLDIAVNHRHSLGFWRSSLNLFVTTLGVMLVFWVVGMATSQQSGLMGDPIGGLYFGLPFGLIFGLRGRWQSVSRDVRTVESLNWSWKRFLVPILVIGALPGSIIYVQQSIRLQTRLQTSRIIWDAQTGERLVNLGGHTKLSELPSPNIGAIFSPDGTQIVTADAAGLTQLWTSSGEFITVLEEHATAKPFPASLSPDGTRIVTAGCDDTFFHQVFHQGDVYFLAYCEATTVKLWDRTGSLIRTFGSSEGEVDSVSFSPDGTRIVTSGWHGNAQLWDLNGNSLEVMESRTSRIAFANFSPDGTRIVTRTRDGTAQLWDGNGKLLNILEAYANWIHSSSFSPDGTRIMTVGCDETAVDVEGYDYCVAGAAKLWDVNGNLIKVLGSYTETVALASFSPDGTRALVVGCDQTDAGIYSFECVASSAKLWDLNGNCVALLGSYEGGIGSVSFSPDGRRIMISSGGLTQIWDVNGNFLDVLESGAGWLESADFSPDGKRIVTRTSNGTAQLWDDDGHLLNTLKGHTGPVKSAVFSPDGTRIVTTSSVFDGRTWALVFIPFGIGLGLLSGLRSSVRETKTSPNQGIWLTGRNAIIVGLAIGVMPWLVFALIATLLSPENSSIPPAGVAPSLATPVLLGGLTALWYGGLDVIQHYVLRLILCFKGDAPWNYARFLDYAAERIFLRKVGGGYIFIHRLLMEYFASLEPEQK